MDKVLQGQVPNLTPKPCEHHHSHLNFRHPGSLVKPAMWMAREARHREDVGKCTFFLFVCIPYTAFRHYRLSSGLRNYHRNVFVSRRAPARGFHGHCLHGPCTISNVSVTHLWVTFVSTHDGVTYLFFGSDGR